MCIEVGSGPGRMTAGLAERFDRVLALDVSPAMLEQARTAVPDEHVEFRAISGERLDGVEDAFADVVVCYLVLQHLPSREVVLSYISEFARTLKPGGEAFVQLPVLEDGLRGVQLTDPILIGSIQVLSHQLICNFLRQVWITRRDL